MEWNDSLRKGIYSQVPNYFTHTYGAIVTTVFSLVLPNSIAASAIKAIAYKVMGQDDADFLVNQYQPTLFKALSTLSLTLSDRFSLFRKTLGTVIKMLYAFLWQEKVIKWWGLHGRISNNLGGKLLPTVNKFADLISGYPAGV